MERTGEGLLAITSRGPQRARLLWTVAKAHESSLILDPDESGGIPRQIYVIEGRDDDADSQIRDDFQAAFREAGEPGRMPPFVMSVI